MSNYVVRISIVVGLFVALCYTYYLLIGDPQVFWKVGFALGSRALSFALWKLGLSGGLAWAFVFFVKDILTAEEASFMGNSMMPSGEGTSGEKPPLPARDESPVPSISSPEKSWIEKTSGDGGKASSLAPSSDLLQGVPAGVPEGVRVLEGERIYEGVPAGVPEGVRVLEGERIYEGVPFYEEIYGTSAQAVYFPTQIYLPNSISDPEILAKLGKLNGYILFFEDLHGELTPAYSLAIQQELDRTPAVSLSSKLDAFLEREEARFQNEALVARQRNALAKLIAKGLLPAFRRG